MGDMAEVFHEMTARSKAHRAKMLCLADIEGWTKHTDYHFSRQFGAERMDWWPSGGKAKYKGKMLYGHRQVNTIIAKLKGLNHE